jgi:hypothetical protein
MMGSLGGKLTKTVKATGKKEDEDFDLDDYVLYSDFETSFDE